MNAPTLETEHLILRPFTDGDVDALVRDILSNPEVLATLPEDPKTPEEQRECAKVEYIDGFMDPWAEEGYGGWAVCARDPDLAAQGTLMGFCGFTPGQFEGEGPELTYGYGQTYWGKGVGAEAAQASIDWFFDESGQDRLNICHYAGNDASKRIIENLGFTFIEDKDLWGSVEMGRGLMPTYILHKDTYFKNR